MFFPDLYRCTSFGATERTGKAVRINITLDEGLMSAIDKVAKSRSGFLADAAR